MPPTNFQLNPTYRSGTDVVFEDFQDGRYGCQLGHRNGTTFAILNLHVELMPPIKFQLKTT